MSISIPDRVIFLKKTQLVRGLTEARLEEIAGRLEERICLEGEAAILQGKVADRIFLIHHGKVSMPLTSADPQAQAEERGAGFYFGEEALSPQSFYAGTVRALEETLLLQLSRNDFHLLPSIFVFERVEFLKRIHLFHGLSDDQFDNVAEMMEERSFKAGTELVMEGAEGDSAFLIYTGKVKVTRKNREKPLAIFVEGDYIGEESVLLKHHRRSATVTAVEDTLTLMLTRENFLKLLKLAPELRSNFTVTATSNRLARKIHFSWLHPDEVIYFLARKHPILLVRMLAVPVLVFLAGLIGMLTAWRHLYSPALDVAWWICMITAFAGAAWIAWNGVDWSNDYYIVTNLRVIWLEKVIGIYDSRQEAPLAAIQRVNVETRLTGRMLDYGDVIVRTIVGSTLNLKNMDHPYQAAALMEEHWQRSRETARQMSEKELDELLRDKLLSKKSRFTQAQSGILARDRGKKDPYEGQRGLGNLLRLRFENQSTVTYRKHLFVLFRQTWKAGLVVLVLLFTLIAELVSRNFSFSALTGGNPGLIYIIWFLLFAAGAGWWVFEYVDWSNDIFQVTPDQILDIDKTPLGQVTSDIAALENILSIEYERKGLMELLMNYGTVFITVGGGKQMAFEDVFNPSLVQADIERRRLERNTSKAKAAEKAEQERLASWFATYYKHEDDYRTEGERVRQIWTDGSAGEEPPAPEKEEPEEENWDTWGGDVPEDEVQ